MGSKQTLYRNLKDMAVWAGRIKAFNKMTYSASLPLAHIPLSLQRTEESQEKQANFSS